MRKLHIIRHINRMNKLSFALISLGSFIFSFSLCALAVNLCQDYLMGASDLLYRYPPMLEHITLPFIFLIGAALTLDINDKRSKKPQ